jgi:inosine/xanthosine triphosphate pyrophosphatase family protein
MRLLVATNNKGKLSEILALLDDVPFEIITPDNL